MIIIDFFFLKLTFISYSSQRKISNHKQKLKNRKKLVSLSEEVCLEERKRKREKEKEREKERERKRKRERERETYVGWFIYSFAYIF